ncbi:MAG: DNA polymerase I, partial [Oscillospiraceae bacterium]
AFDRSEPTFRHEIFSEYKANRDTMPNDFAEQLPFLKNILIYLGVKIVDCPHYEADDILGTISRVCKEKDIPCNVVSGDKDIFQLIEENINVIMLRNREQILYTEQDFIDEFGYKPINVIDFKAIAGDSSDNYKGIKGIGEKTITPLIQQYGTVENIYTHIDDLKLTPRYIKLLKDNQNEAILCKKLATISRNAPIDTDINTYQYNGISNESDLLDVLKYLEMNTFIKKFGLKEDIKSKKIPKIDVVLLMDNFTTKSQFTNYTINDGTLYINDNETIYKTDSLEIIKNYLESDVNKSTISVKNHYTYTDNIKNITTDTELCGYLLDTSSKEYTVKSLCRTYNIDYFQELGEFADIYSLPKLNTTLSKKVSDLNMDNLLSLELKISKVLADMEKTGVKVDVETVKKYQFELEDILVDLQNNIYQLAGRDFKILSPKQLGEILFDELHLPPSKKTKTGYSTDNDVLENLKDKHPIIPLIIEFRFYHKLKSTYLDGLLKTVALDGRIHTIFRQTETRTGRLSSAEPNLQNIPIRNDFAKNIRKFFIADDDKVLIDADYNQIELRLTAIMSKDTNMINNFLSGEDIHTATAMKIFNCDKLEVTPQMRGVAKSINFGLIYGMGASKLSREINIKKPDAEKYIENYFNMYPNIKTFMENIVENCKKDGYVKTILNRIRYIPEIKSSNKLVQASGNRVAMNTPIQGSSADIIKLAMVKVFDRLQNENLNAKLILQVHDELLIESDKSCAETVAKIVKEEMENVMQLDIPLTVEINIGGSWFDAH